MKKTVLACWALACIFTLSAPAPFAAAAEEMPAPRRMPRTPVSRQVLEIQHEAAPASRTLQGPAMVIDGDKMRMGETDLRLFGVVPPQLSASFGPQARATLDQLANGQSVNCQIRDRDHDGRLLATCHASNGEDMALELLKRGLAVAARGSISGTDLAAPYLSAEQAAQLQKIGLWSMASPAPASAPAIAVAAAAAAPVVAHVDPAPAPVAPVVVKEDKAPAHTDKNIIAPAAAADTQSKITADVLDQGAQARIDETTDQESNVGFFERYQILIAGLLMLTTALSVIGAIWASKQRDKRDETKSVAAALRGELMAARAICIGRSKSITNEDEDHDSIWPRIRSTLYQAYVGRLGLLGAELARQISSIYGQSSDYAALYNPNGAGYDSPKKQALDTLARHIDEVLPKLAGVEQTGTTPTALIPQRPRSHYDEPTTPFLRATAAHVLQAPYKAISPSHSTATPAPEKKIAHQQPRPKPVVQEAVAPEPTESFSEAFEPSEPAHEAPAPSYEQPPAAEAKAEPIYESKAPVIETAAAPAAVLEAKVVTPPPAVKIEHAVKPAVLWEIVRGFIQNHRNAILQTTPAEDQMNEYAAMIEADMARYPYTAEGRETRNSAAKTRR